MAESTTKLPVKGRALRRLLGRSISRFELVRTASSSRVCASGRTPLGAVAELRGVNDDLDLLHGRARRSSLTRSP